jgi:DNA-binding NarL/FixJ family response regulator
LAASPSRLSDVEALTERERVVLSLMAKGLSNREIADALHLAIGTVKTHVSAILRKLGVRNRTEAALISMGVRER